MKFKFKLLCCATLILLGAHPSFADPKVTSDARATKQNSRSLKATHENLEHLLRKRTPAGSSKAQVEAILETRRKAKNASFERLSGEKLRRDTVVQAVIYFNRYDPTIVKEAIYATENFTSHDEFFRLGTVFLFDKKDKLIQVFVSVIEAKPSLDEVKKKVQDANLLGSDRARVEAWLKNENLDSWYLSAKEELEWESDVRQSSHEASELSGLVRATIPDVGLTFPVIWSIRVVFFFGKDGKLKDYTASQTGFGP